MKENTIKPGCLHKQLSTFQGTGRQFCDFTIDAVLTQPGQMHFNALPETYAIWIVGYYQEIHCLIP
jgi:hypothetical protein